MNLQKLFLFFIFFPFWQIKIGIFDFLMIQINKKLNQIDGFKSRFSFSFKTLFFFLFLKTALSPQKSYFFIIFYICNVNKFYDWKLFISFHWIEILQERNWNKKINVNKISLFSTHFCLQAKEFCQFYCIFILTKFNTRNIFNKI